MFPSKKKSTKFDAYITSYKIRAKKKKKIRLKHKSQNSKLSRRKHVRKCL